MFSLVFGQSCLDRWDLVLLIIFDFVARSILDRCPQINSPSSPVTGMMVTGLISLLNTTWCFEISLCCPTRRFVITVASLGSPLALHWAALCQSVVPLCWCPCLSAASGTLGMCWLSVMSPGSSLAVHFLCPFSGVTVILPEHRVDSPWTFPTLTDS